MANVIYAGNARNSDYRPVTTEGVCLDAMLPGTQVVQTAAGIATDTDTAAATNKELLISNKNEMQTRSVNEPWAVGENMVVLRPLSGDFINVRVLAGNNITSLGVALVQTGVGQFRLATATDEAGQVFSDEIVNVTADNTLVRVRVA